MLKAMTDSDLRTKEKRLKFEKVFMKNFIFFFKKKQKTYVSQ